jgi:hypothetical protein
VNITIAPTFRVDIERRQLAGERGRAAKSLEELLADRLLAELTEILAPGRALTKEDVAQAVESAVRTAHTVARAGKCEGCGHAFGDHVAMGGCFECDCMARRPHASELAPVGGAA